MRINQTLYLVIASVLVVANLIWVIIAFNAPTTREKELTQNYDITGKFDHEGYGTPVSRKPPPNPIHFIQIIDSIVVHYSYRFTSEEPLSRVSGTAQLSGILSSPGQWEKEVLLIPVIDFEGGFSTSFTLNTNELVELADNISEELGIGASSLLLTLKAAVYSVANVESTIINESFIQTFDVQLTPNIIEWRGLFPLTKKGYNNGMTYEQYGTFGYSVNLKPNILYGDISLNSFIAPVPPPILLDKSPSYRRERVETIEATLDYKITSEEQLTNIRHEVEVNALLSKPNGERISFSLLPKSQKIEDFSLTFPLDIPLFYDIILAAEGEINEYTPTYTLLVEADVHTSAESEVGPIEEDFSKIFVVTMQPDSLVLSNMTEEKQSGSISKTVITPNSGRTAGIMGSLGVLGVMLTVLLYTIYLYRQSRKAPAWDEEVTRAKKEHKDIIVDVLDLPPTGEQMLIPIDSLDNLVKVANALLKPVLHKTEAYKHIYHVSDGLMTYAYILHAIR